MPKGFHDLTQDLRCQIYAFKSMGMSQREIARKLNIAASTVNREIKRNTGGKSYRYTQADEKAKERRSRASRTPKKMTPEFKALINERLEQGWSPEQIAGRFKLEGIFISHETIYRYIWRDKRQGGFLYRYLRHNGKRYNKRSFNKA